jgi:cell volume regulation protein A
LAHIEQIILLSAALVSLSILAGMFSSRLGAPLLLVFLGLGMLAGEDGPGGIVFSDFSLTYLVGSVSLAIILFDGALRTPRATFRIAMWPALSLATVGVVVTAVIAGAVAVLVLGLTPLEGFLVGATVASTDAAAVFLLLHKRGTELKKRVSATLEIESGINDPMAVFLTIACVELLLKPELAVTWHVAASFVIQMGGGAIIGVGGGYALLWLINRIEIASGLYPILAGSCALVVFSGAQIVDASGFLAVYLAGLVLGNHRHRAQAVIARFHDGLAWLAQIAMFLLLGLLVTPSALLDRLAGELIIAVALLLVARPVAVWLCLLPFRFTWQEKAFIAWVGLRGAVPIFLASIPVLFGVPRGMAYFNVAFVVVLFSLVVQGWTVTKAATLLGLELPPPPEPVERLEIELPTGTDREAGGWRVVATSPALAVPFQELSLPKRTRIISVIRDGTLMNRATLERLAVDDYVIALSPPEQTLALDKLFAPRAAPGGEGGLGEFVVGAETTLGRVCGLYGVPFEPLDRDKTLAEFLTMRLGETVVVGDRVRVGAMELVVRDVEKDHIAKVGLEFEPETERLPILRLWRRLTGRGAA